MSELTAAQKALFDKLKKTTDKTAAVAAKPAPRVRPNPSKTSGGQAHSKARAETSRSGTSNTMPELSALSGGAGSNLSFEQRMMVYEAHYALVEWGKDTCILKRAVNGRPFKLQSLEAFYNANKNDVIVFKKFDDDGNLVSQKPKEAAREWVKWERRTKYEDVKFSPANKQALDEFNLWSGHSVDPAPGDWSALRKHVFEVICRENPMWFAAVMSWFADIVQNPEERHNTIIVCQGLPGSGKSTMALLFSMLIPNHRSLITKQAQLIGKFNAHLELAVFVYVEEAMWAGDREGEGVLKSLGSDPYQQIERKGYDPKLVDNFTHLWMNSNNEWVAPVREGDRRYFVLRTLDKYAESVASPADRRAHFDAIYDQMDPKNDPEMKGLAAMLYDLQQLRQPEWIDLRSPIKTPWHAEQAEQSLETYEAWLFQALLDNSFALEGGANNIVFSPEGLEVDKEVLRGSLDYFARSSRRGKSLDSRALGKTLSKYGVGSGKRGKRGEQKPHYLFPPLETMRERFAKTHGVNFAALADSPAGSSEGDLTNEPYRALGAENIDPEELDAWRCYGEGGPLP